MTTGFKKINFTEDHDQNIVSWVMRTKANTVNIAKMVRWGCGCSIYVQVFEGILLLKHGIEMELWLEEEYSPESFCIKMGDRTAY
jgi:hypothetical protein